MSSADCCCDLTPHPDDRLTWTGTKAEGSRYQLISGTCHVDFIEVMVHTSAETDTVTVAFFTNDDPSTAASDVNVWNLSVGKSEGSTAWTPDQFKGVLFRDGLFAEVMSADTTAEVNINIVYYRRDTYTPALPETPYQRRERLWKCYNEIVEDDKEYEPYGDNFDKGYEGDDYSDTSSGSTPGTKPGDPFDN